MPRICTVCSSPNRPEIDEAVTRGESFRRIAPRYAVSDRALRRHAAAHVPGAIVKAHEAAETARADDLLDLLREGVADARRLRGKAEAAEDYRGAIACVKTLADLVESLVKVAERLAEKESDLLGSPAWDTLFDAILSALAAHPQAREDVRVAVDRLAAGT